MDILQLWPRMVATHSVVFPPLSAAAQPGGGSLTSLPIICKKKINFKNLAVALWPTPPTPSKFSSQSNFFRPSLNRWRQFPLERVIILLLDNASLHCQSNYSASKYIWNSTQPRKQTAAQYPYQIWRWHGEQIYTLRQVLETLTISDWRDLDFLHRFIQALPSNIVFHIIQFGVLVWLLYTSASFRNPKYT